MTNEKNRKEATNSKQGLFELISYPESRTSLSCLFAALVIIACIMSGGVALLETYQLLNTQYFMVFVVIEITFGAILFLDFILRFYWKQMKYLFSIFGLIDMLSALSFVL